MSKDKLRTLKETIISEELSKDKRGIEWATGVARSVTETKEHSTAISILKKYGYEISLDRDYGDFRALGTKKIGPGELVISFGPTLDYEKMRADKDRREGDPMEFVDGEFNLWAYWSPNKSITAKLKSIFKQKGNVAKALKSFKVPDGFSKPGPAVKGKDIPVRLKAWIVKNEKEVAAKKEAMEWATVVVQEADNPNVLDLKDSKSVKHQLDIVDKGIKLIVKKFGNVKKFVTTSKQRNAEHASNALQRMASNLHNDSDVLREFIEEVAEGTIKESEVVEEAKSVKQIKPKTTESADYLKKGKTYAALPIPYEGEVYAEVEPNTKRKDFTSGGKYSDWYENEWHYNEGCAFVCKITDA